MQFIRDLGLEYAVQDGQKLLLNRKGEFVEVYLDSSHIGIVNRESLRNYLSGNLRVESE